MKKNILQIGLWIVASIALNIFGLYLHGFIEQLKYVFGSVFGIAICALLLMKAKTDVKNRTPPIVVIILFSLSGIVLGILTPQIWNNLVAFPVENHLLFSLTPLLGDNDLFKYIWGVVCGFVSYGILMKIIKTKGNEREPV